MTGHQHCQACLILQVSTVVLRASTDNTLDDLERAVDDGVNAYKVCSSSVICAREKCQQYGYPLCMLICSINNH